MVLLDVMLHRKPHWVYTHVNPACQLTSSEAQSQVKPPAAKNMLIKHKPGIILLNQVISYLRKHNKFSHSKCKKQGPF